MDYRGFAQGVTVHFPVFVPGALLHVGDGHALQGDGEIVGTGVETSFDVQFTIGLIKDKTIQCRISPCRRSPFGDRPALSNAAALKFHRKAPNVRGAGCSICKTSSGP